MVLFNAFLAQGQDKWSRFLMKSVKLENRLTGIVTRQCESRCPRNLHRDEFSSELARTIVRKIHHPPARRAAVEHILGWRTLERLGATLDKHFHRLADVA